MGRRLKSILVLVPEEGEITAYRNFHGEHTKPEMLEIACGWLDANPGGIVMYDDEVITPNVKNEKEPEEGIIIDGLYVPAFMLHGVKNMKWGVNK